MCHQQKELVAVFLLLLHMLLFLPGHRPVLQTILSGVERQFCVSDLSGPTAGERSVSAPGHQSGFVNFLHSTSQLLSPPNLTAQRKSGG